MARWFNRFARLFYFVLAMGMEMYVFLMYLQDHHHTNLLPWCWVYWLFNVLLFMFVIRFVNVEVLP
jgi:uncharacterized membrane protein